MAKTSSRALARTHAHTHTQTHARAHIYRTHAHISDKVTQAFKTKYILSSCGDTEHPPPPPPPTPPTHNLNKVTEVFQN